MIKLFRYQGLEPPWAPLNRFALVDSHGAVGPTWALNSHPVSLSSLMDNWDQSWFDRILTLALRTDSHVEEEDLNKKPSLASPSLCLLMSLIKDATKLEGGL